MTLTWKKVNRKNSSSPDRLSTQKIEGVEPVQNF